MLLSSPLGRSISDTSKRMRRALAIWKDMEWIAEEDVIDALGPGTINTYRSKSQTHPGTFYITKIRVSRKGRLRAFRCTCPDGEDGCICKHALACWLDAMEAILRS